MRKSTLLRVGKRSLQIGLPLLVLGIFLYTLHGDWQQLTAHAFAVNPWWLALAFFGFLLQVLSYGFIWQRILARLGEHLDIRVSLRIYLASEFVRYIPGNVWHVLTRILWVGRYGVSRSVAFASMTIELITKLAAAALVFAITLLFWSDIGAIRSLVYGTPLVIGIGVSAILGLLIGLHPRILNGLLNVALRILKREPIELKIRYSDILLITLEWGVSWTIAGCAFYILLLALLPGASITLLPICIGICAIAWDIGFLSFITPSGLGFREGAVSVLFALALPHVVPFASAAILAILWRVVSTCAEVLCVGIAYLSGGKQVRTVRQEQEHLTTQSDGEMAEEAIDTTLAQASTHIGVEGRLGNG